MACGQLRVGDVGSLIRVTVTECSEVFDASSGSATMSLQAPDGSVITRTAQPETDGSDGVFIYMTQAGDLSMAGPWTGQLQVTLPSGQWTSEPFSFSVGAVLAAPVVSPSAAASRRVPVASRGGVA